ncbi:hypothetical protein JCM6882_002011 [Rhodosporidiobolus microsporus]
MSLPYRVIDAFTSTPFSGNPASVVLFPPNDARSADSSLMLRIAREFALSETAYLVPRPSSPSSPDVPVYGLRWFTPTVEFPLCGHATLASAHCLFGEHHPEATKLQFETSMSGTLFASRLEDGQIELDFPADVTVVNEVDPFEEEDLRDKLILVHAALAANVVRVAKGKLAWIVELKPDFDLETASLDVSPLRGYKEYFVFTQPRPSDNSQHDIYSRVFDPVESDPEDAVTGSAHCMLAPYYLSLAKSRLPNPAAAVESLTLRAKQGGPRRQGEMTVRWDREQWRCKLRGSAVTVMEGKLLV